MVDLTQGCVNEKTAARMLGVHHHTLGNWRTAGQGPPYFRPSRGVIRYPVAELRAWLDARLSAAKGAA